MAQFVLPLVIVSLNRDNDLYVLRNGCLLYVKPYSLYFGIALLDYLCLVYFICLGDSNIFRFIFFVAIVYLFLLRGIFKPYSLLFTELERFFF